MAFITSNDNAKILRVHVNALTSPTRTGTYDISANKACATARWQSLCAPHRIHSFSSDSLLNDSSGRQSFIVTADSIVTCLGNQRRLQPNDTFFEEILKSNTLCSQAT